MAKSAAVTMQNLPKLPKPELQPLHGCNKELEPYVLRKLKYQLLNCKCMPCITDNRGYKHIKHSVLQTSTTELQTDQTKCNKHIQASCRNCRNASTETKSLQKGIMKFGGNQSLCPTCLIAFSLFRGGFYKIYKDEECETVKEMANCDKSTSRDIVSADKCTSMTSRLLSLSPDISECSRLTKRTWYTSNSSSSVTSYLGGDTKEHLRQFQAENLYYNNIDNFIDSIRPCVNF